MKEKQKKEVPFLYYVRNGKCKPSRSMPDSGDGFDGWLTASHVIRYQDRHEKRDIKVAMEALRVFMANLKDHEFIQQRDLRHYVK